MEGQLLQFWGAGSFRLAPALTLMSVLELSFLALYWLVRPCHVHCFDLTLVLIAGWAQIGSYLATLYFSKFIWWTAACTVYCWWFVDSFLSMILFFMKFVCLISFTWYSDILCYFGWSYVHILTVTSSRCWTAYRCYLWILNLGSM